MKFIKHFNQFLSVTTSISMTMFFAKLHRGRFLIRALHYFIIFLLASFSLDAKLEDHFKPAKGKTENHQMRNIDYIYMINLDQRPEKYEKSIKQLVFWEINPYRFSAVNGWELPLETITDVGVVFEPQMSTGIMGTYYEKNSWKSPTHEYISKIGRTYFSHCLALGSIGIALSHLSVLQDAYDSGYETIWVMEDDINIIRNPHMMSDLIEELDATVGKENWDVLYTDRDTKNSLGFSIPCSGFSLRPNFYPANPAKFAQKTRISINIREVGARYGTYSMIIRKSGMKKILDFLKEYKVFFPIDFEIPLCPSIRLFTVLSEVVSTCPDAASDNGSPNYLSKKSHTITCETTQVHQ